MGNTSTTNALQPEIASFSLATRAVYTLSYFLEARELLEDLGANEMRLHDLRPIAGVKSPKGMAEAPAHLRSANSSGRLVKYELVPEEWQHH